MGSALGSAWRQAGYSVTACDSDEACRRHAQQKNIETFASVGQLKGRPFDIVVLAVKPQQMMALVHELDGDKNDAMIISIAAGIELTHFTSQGRVAVRAMPNLPVLVSAGMTALYGEERMTAHDKKLASDLFECCGDILWLKEEALLNDVTALAGSGPAYVFYFLECLSMAGQFLHLDEAQSYLLARQTLKGAMELALRTKTMKELEKLRHDVTSPQGTTAAAMQILSDAHKGLAPLLKETLKAAHKRARELNQQQEK